MMKCCFTGHRPNKLPWGYSEKGIRFFLFRRKLKKTILNAINDGYDYFISGMAIGIDMLCAKIVLELKKKHFSIKLECAIPCLNQTAKWNDESKVRYSNILKQADKIIYVSNINYYSGCMSKRNKYMIDSSDMLIAVYNGSEGGTKQTIEMAKKANLKIVLVKLLIKKRKFKRLYVRKENAKIK